MSEFKICCPECGNTDFYLKEDGDDFTLICKECNHEMDNNELICGIEKINK